MDLKNFQMTNVVLRVLDDGQVQGSENFLTVLTNQSVELNENSPTTIDGFAKKDKLAYSPSNKFYSQNTEDFKGFNEKIFNFDRVLVNEYPGVDLAKSAIVVSIGKSDSLTGMNGLIFQSILAALGDSWNVQITCGVFSQGKVTCFVENAMVSCIKGAADLLNFEYFAGEKNKENLLITTLTLEKDLSKRVFYFFDICQSGKISDIFINVFCNGGAFDKIQGDDIIYDILGAAFAYSPKITVIGNITPSLPYSTQTKSLLQSLSHLHRKKKNLNKIFSKILLQELRKANFKIFELEKTNELQRKTIETLKYEQKEANIENSSLKEKLIKFDKDEERAKMMNQIASFQEKYLIKLAEMAELEEKLKELSDLKEMGKNALGKKQNLLGSSLAMELDFKRNKVSQDYGTSPIRSLTLTEKTAFDRIEQLNSELEVTKAKLKVLSDKEELLQFQVPPGTIDHHSYHEVITALYRLLEAMKSHYNDLFHQLQLRYNLQISVYENRDQFLRQKLSFSQTTHLEKLQELQEKENSFTLKENCFNELTEKYKKLKDDYEQYKSEVIQYKKTCQEKMTKAKADTNIRKELDNKEREIEDLQTSMKSMQEEYEKNNLEVLRDKNEEIARMKKKYEEQINELNTNIGMLKAMLLSGKN